MRKTLSLLLVLILLMVPLIACGQKDAAAPANSSASDKPADEGGQKDVTLKFAIWGGDAHKQMYEGIIKKYNAEHPHVNVEVLTIPFADYLQKLTITQASKTAPDLAWLSVEHIPQMLNNGQLLDLSSLKTDPDYNFDDIYASTLGPVTKDGKLYGIPFSTPPSMMYYNKTLFKEHGLKTPNELYKEGKWNYDEFLKAAQAITDPSKGIYGANFVSKGWESWLVATLTVFNSYGAKFFSPDETKFLLNSPEAEQALQFYSDLMFKYQVHPKPGDQTTFESGKIGMQKEFYSYIGNVRNVKDFEWDIAPLPAGPKGPGTYFGYAVLSVMKDSPHTKEAVDFLKYISNSENMETATQFFVPTRKTVLESDAFLSQGPSPESMRTAIIEALPNSVSVPTHKNWQQIDTKMRTIMDYLYTQKYPVKEILNKAEEEITPLMN